VQNAGSIFIFYIWEIVMKKSLLALALLGAFTGAASAQNSVTLYGVVDAGIASENKGAGNVLSMQNGGQSISRFGFKGTEDLGGGLSALFVLEGGFLPGTGASNSATKFWDRQSWVGLKGGFGTARLGRQETLVFAAFNKGYDPFGRGLAGDIERMFLIAGSGKRTDNSVTYSTPVFGGFKGDLAYTLGEVAGSNAEGREYGVSLEYVQGPVGVIYARHDANNKPTAPAPLINGKTNFLAGTYNFGVAKAYLAYGDNKNDAAAAASKIDTRTGLIGVSVPVGAHLFIADYISTTNKAFANKDAKQIAVGYTYTLSKRTNLYTSYSRTTNESAGTTNVSVAGASDRLLNVGVRHIF
jgi:predicted porin